jgi:PST family polysaccharide transporter
LSATAPLSPQLRRAGATIAAGAVVSRLLQLAAYALLARRLAPADFGALSLASVAVNALALLPGLGLGTALLAQRADPRPVARTALSAALLGGVGVVAASFAVGAFVARQKGAEVGELVPLLGLALFFQGPGTIASALLDRELRFAPRVAADVAGGAAFALGALLAARCGLGARSLALGLVASAATQSAVTLGAARLVPTLRPRWRELRGTSRLGALVLATTLLQWLFVSSDVYWIEHRFGRDALGLYSTALQLVMAPATALGLFSSRLALPALIRTRDEGARRGSGFLRATAAAAALAAAAAALFVVAPRPLIELLYGPRFAAAAPLLPLLAIHSFARVLGGLAGPALLATGLARAALALVLVQDLVAIPLAGLVPAEYGAAGVALVYSLAAAAACVVALRVGAARLALPGDGTLRAALLPWIGGVAPAVAAVLFVPNLRWIGLAAGIAVLVLQARRRWRQGAFA